MQTKTQSAPSVAKQAGRGVAQGLLWLVKSPLPPVKLIADSIAHPSIADGSIRRGDLVRAAWTHLKAALNRKPGRTETFTDAKARLGVADRVIEQRGRQHILVSRGCYAGATVALMYSGYQAYAGYLFGTCVTLALTSMAFVHAWGYAFRAWQIRERRLAPFAEFARAPEAWIA
jgi:hypothetical protein